MLETLVMLFLRPRSALILVLALSVSMATREADMKPAVDEQGDITYSVKVLDEKGDNFVLDSNLIRRKRAVNDHVMENPSKQRRKRAMNYGQLTWGYSIPVIFDSTFSDPLRRNMVKKIIRHINSRTCLNLVDETERWNSTNPRWFTENGYKYDSRIKIMNEKGCAVGGPGISKEGVFLDAKTCSGTEDLMHELLHALGGAHCQEAYMAPRYISVFKDNIIPEMFYTFDSSHPKMSGKYYDVSSTLQYHTSGFSINGENTWECIRPDFCSSDGTVSMENVIIEEINERYNCSDVYCNQSRIDCSPGYLTRIGQTCKCVCPPEFNSGTNCKTLINGADSSLKWPVPLTVIAGGDQFKCPNTFQKTGWVSFCGTKPSWQDLNPAPFPKDGTTVYIPICSKTEPSSNIDWDAFPLGGDYCFIKPSGIPCGGVFTDAVTQIESTCDVKSNGSVGSIEISGPHITIKMCCTSKEQNKYQILLPNETPFQLFLTGSCPMVHGMRTIQSRLVITPRNITVTGTPAKPYYYTWNKENYWFLCYFQPPVYGCNRYMNLTPGRRSAVFTTPGYPRPRPPNRRCIYCVNAPTGSQIRVTFNRYDLGPDDKFRIKRFHKWAEPYRINNDDPPYQFVTESSYLCMEFWTGFQITNNVGVNATVDLLLDSESCYNTSQNGMDYVGSTNITETYEPCLPWKETTSCSDSPFNAPEALTGYFESNYCRNPGGKLTQPWCYVWRNETNCAKRYCDVCNTKVPVDVLTPPVCSAAIDKDRTFCQKTVQRLGCFKSCGMTQAHVNPPGICSRPQIPKDGAMLGSLKSSYRAGERVYVRCARANARDEATHVMMCTKNGWSYPISACTECPIGWTIDDGRCILFSNEVKTRDDAEKFCRNFGRNGTLLQVRNVKDQETLRSLRREHKSNSEHTWISGYFCKSPDKWCYTDGSTIMKFFKWSENADKRDANKAVIFVYRESSTSKRDGLWYSTERNPSTRYTVACQIDRATQPEVNDKYRTCQTVLKDNPDFCKDQKTTKDALLYCSRSCGLMKGTPKCQEPRSTRYRRTSANATVNAGDVMTFACKDGYFLTGGDTRRACGIGGSLLGAEPVCDGRPLALDVGLRLVKSRSSAIGGRSVFLMDVPGYRVPINGAITTWFASCKNKGPIYFLAFRKNQSNYRLIGYNMDTCQRWPTWGFSVPQKDQISVQAGDIVGAWIPESNVLSVNNCFGTKLNVMYMPKGSAKQIDELKRKTIYNETGCIIPSFAYRVERTW